MPRSKTLLGFVLVFCNILQPSETRVETSPPNTTCSYEDFFKKYDQRFVPVDVDPCIKEEDRYIDYGNFFVICYRSHPQGLRGVAFNVDTGIVRLYYARSCQMEEIKLPHC